MNAIKLFSLTLYNPTWFSSIASKYNAFINCKKIRLKYEQLTVRLKDAESNLPSKKMNELVALWNASSTTPDFENQLYSKKFTFNNGTNFIVVSIGDFRFYLPTHPATFITINDHYCKIGKTNSNSVRSIQTLAIVDKEYKNVIKGTVFTQ